MKPWLVEFRLLPRPRSPRATGRTEPASAWTATRPLPQDFARRVAALGLPPEASGSEASRAWGVVDGNRLEIQERAGETSVRVRVDTRKLDPGFAAALLGLVRTTNGVLVRSDGLMIDGTVGSFSRALRSSPAWAHVDDPTGLLTGREPGGEDEQP